MIDFKEIGMMIFGSSRIENKRIIRKGVNRVETNILQ